MADIDKHYTRLARTSDVDDHSFHSLMWNFGVVTVMNADVYFLRSGEGEGWGNKTPYEIVKFLQEDRGMTPICHLDTLKIANVTVEGPSKTISGGQYADPLIKFGKTARLEMQDALGNIKAIDKLCGGVAEKKNNSTGDYIALHIGEDFNSPVAIIGDTFFISRATQEQVPVKIIFYQFMPDSIFNLTQDAEGDAAVFDMNGELLATEVKIGSKDGTPIQHDLFYSIIDPNHYPLSGGGGGK